MGSITTVLFRGPTESFRWPRTLVRVLAIVLVLVAVVGVAFAEDGVKIPDGKYDSAFVGDATNTSFTVSNGGNTLTTANFTYTWNAQLCKYVRPGACFTFYGLGACDWTLNPPNPPGAPPQKGVYWRVP